MIIQWTNKYSNEQGYVKSVNIKERHFVNTFNRDEAKNYKQERNAVKVIEQLTSFGEADNNNFAIITN